MESQNMGSNSKVGSIHLILGCMFSGKSTELIRLAGRYKVLGKRVFVVNHSLDKRYKENSVSTHGKLSIDCVLASDLEKEVNPLTEYQECDVLIIEEAQFFTGLYQFVLDACEKDHKDVIVVGLDGDSNRTDFGEILKLIPVSDSYKKLYGLCVVCKDGTPACFSKRIVKNEGQILVGSDEFIAVCRKHFIH